MPMQYVTDLPANRGKVRIYYSNKVYDPHYSSADVPSLAARFTLMNGVRVLDVACGSGFAGIILKKLNPHVSVEMTDLDHEALRVARLNAKRNGANVKVYKADLIPPKQTYHLIMANLPTFTPEQMKKEPLRGPELAYNGGEDGLDLYRRLLTQAKGRTVVLVCECQAVRKKAFRKLAAETGWSVLADTGNAVVLVRNDTETQAASST